MNTVYGGVLMERGSLHYHMEIDAALLYVQKKSSSSRIMSGKRRAGNPSNCSSNCNDSSNGFHHHHRGLGNMPSKREMENLPVLDLHGCFKQDAKRKVTDFLEQQQRAQTNKSSCSNHNGQGRLCKIITGTGAHSSATGGPILKTAVENLLTKRQMHFDCKTIPGAFIVDAATGIVLESRACTATDTKIVLAHAEDEAVVLQRAAQQQGKRRAAASASAHARSNNRLSSSHETNNNNLLNGPSVSEVALADKALEWAQVESRKVQQQQHHLAKSDAKQVERAIDISLREHSSSHMDDDDDDDDVAWQEEFERALKISQQETTMTPDNVQERIKQALQESARLEAERIEMEKRELLELEMALRLSQECSSSTATTAFKTDELVEQDDEDLELERALRESARQQELEAAMRLALQQQAAAEARVVRDRERQLKLETRATMERQRALEKQIALEQRQRAALEKQELEKQAREKQALDRLHELERQRQIALEKKQASALAWQQELEKQAALAWQLASALRIQATVRGYQCRRMTCIMKTRILAATVLLQAYWRRGLTLAIHQHQKRAAAAAASTAATLIQSVTRSYQCRRLLLVSQAAEKETARKRRLDEEENEKLAMALQKEENEKVATAFAFHMCVEEVDEDQKQLGIAMSLSQQETEKQRALPPPGAAACHEWHKAVFKKQSEVEKQATSEWQKVQEDLERQAACIGQRYFCAHCNCHHGTEEEEEEEKLALKEAPLESKESREQLKQAPENSSQSSPALSRRDCVDKTEEEESMNQQGSTSKPPPTAPAAVTISKPQSSSQLKPTPTPAAPTTTQGVQGGVEDSKRRAVLNNSTKQSPGEATRQEETPGRAAEQQAPRVEDASSSSGYAMQFPERRESAKSKKDTEDLDQAILEASRSKDANFLADFLSRSF